MRLLKSISKPEVLGLMLMMVIAKFLTKFGLSSGVAFAIVLAGLIVLLRLYFIKLYGKSRAISIFFYGSLLIVLVIIVLDLMGF